MITANTRPRTLVELKPAVESPEALPDRVYSILKYRILTCVLPPGQRLNEQEIAAELEVSRTPLREALNRLAQENLLARTPYRGYAVAPVTAEDIRNLCEVRLILETEAAGLAAERGTPDELGRLVQCVDLRYTPGDRETYAEYLKANSIFHRELARATHNVRLESMVMAVLDELQRPLYLGLDVGLDAKSATQEHLILVGAVKDRDPARARRLQAEQITRAGERMVAAIRSTAAALGGSSGG
jgi:DNA-binding GntR family transcriptional regulator